MNKKETRHQLIRSIITETNIYTQNQLRDILHKNGIDITQATLSRDIKELQLIKLSSEGHYVIHSISPTQWERRLRIYMEDALIFMRPVKNQIILKTLPGLAQSFGSILDSIHLPHIIGTICGDDTCLIICEDDEQAIVCFDVLKQYAPPFFFSHLTENS